MLRLATAYTQNRARFHHIVFILRALVWLIGAIFAWGHAEYGWIWALFAILVGSGLALWRNPNGLEIFNQIYIPIDVIVLSWVIARSGGLNSPAYLLYGGEALYLAAYGTLRYSMVGSVVVAVLYGIATAGWDTRIFWWRVIIFAFYFLGAAALGREYRLARFHHRESGARLAQVSRLKALQDSIFADESIESVLSRLLEEVREMTRADVGYVARMDANQRVNHIIVKGITWPEEVSFDECRPPERMEIFTAAQVSGCRAHVFLEQAGMNSFASIPLQYEGHCYGWVGLATTNGQEMFLSSEFIMQNLADVMAAQILFQESQAVANKRGQLLAILERVGRIVNRNLDMDNLLKSLRSAVADVLDLDGFFVALTLPNDHEHVLLQYLWDDGEEYPPEIFPKEPDGLTGRVIVTGEPLLLNGPDKAATLTGSRRMPRGMIVVPLMYEGRTLGAISSQSYRAEYGPDDVEFLSAIASQASIAIRNAQMYQQTQEIALTDYLTGLGNSRRFNLVIQAAAEVSSETGQSLALILLDSDSLKSINDRFGHRAGDLHLQRVAQVIRENIREDDVACRYAGDEFVIILPKSDLHDAQQVAERIRREIESHRLAWNDSVIMGATISVGVARYGPSMTVDALFQAADRAMYEAKQQGKNRVAIAP